VLSPSCSQSRKKREKFQTLSWIFQLKLWASSPPKNSQRLWRFWKKVAKRSLISRLTPIKVSNFSVNQTKPNSILLVIKSNSQHEIPSFFQFFKIILSANSNQLIFLTSRKWVFLFSSIMLHHTNSSKKKLGWRGFKSKNVCKLFSQSVEKNSAALASSKNLYVQFCSVHMYVYTNSKVWEIVQLIIILLWRFLNLFAIYIEIQINLSTIFLKKKKKKKRGKTKKKKK